MKFVEGIKHKYSWLTIAPKVLKEKYTSALEIIFS
jgi:hypothetical protein